MQLQEPNVDVAHPLVPISQPERARIPSSLPQDMTQQAANAIESLKGDDPKVFISNQFLVLAKLHNLFIL